MPSLPAPNRMQAALWVALFAAALWLLAQLAPILTPFLLAGILAYICDPAVERLQRIGLPRLAAVLAVLVAAGLLLVALGLILAPLLVEEAAVLAARLPDALALANDRLAPWLRETFGIRLALDAESLKALAGENMDSLQAIARKLYESLRIGGVALLGFAINLLLVPVVMFYLLLDWGRLLERIGNAIPRPWHDRTMRLARDVDAVLSEFLRGQLWVMLILAAYYSIALWLAGIPSALAIGLLTGLLIFVPYLGFATGLILGLLVAALQFQGASPVIAVLAVFGIGQLLESFLLTPFLVGNRIGLHPLAVIFALMAFGQLFGFFGILLALPASAALLVGLRELRAAYLASRFYTGR
ncbi:MAG: AI-2E family transporter [Candidatus Nitricoxidivorans perseverans]|uniref:AI-2E family transporter n=1 Tax=Candidatus Nitricoxidivorans perseverans TaxID=2975601 RepID=A0AA49FMW3_9PROT|nr:MAG: AI-2E family transporter [Candidatus Nitricoxidivorans perseverans]